MLVTLALSLSLLYCSFSQALDETQQRSPLGGWGAVQTRKRVKTHESGEEGRGPGSSRCEGVEVKGQEERSSQGSCGNLARTFTVPDEPWRSPADRSHCSFRD